MARILVEAFDGLIGGRIVNMPAGTELTAAVDGDAVLAAGAATFEFQEGDRAAVESAVAAWRAVSATRVGVKLISFVSQAAPPVARGVYTPTVTANEGITVIDPVVAFGFDPGFYTRIGGGVPGDIATLNVWLAASNEGEDPLTATLTATLPAGMPFTGEIIPGASMSLDSSGDDPWDGAPWDLVAVVGNELRARFELAAGASSARWVTVSYPVGAP